MEPKKKLSTKVRILTVIIIIVSFFYWIIGKIEVCLANISHKEDIEQSESKEE